MSVFGLVGLGASLSVLDLAFFGASLALRAFARIGSTMSLLGNMRMGASFSVLDGFQLGSTVAIRSFGRLGCSLSVLGSVQLGSSLSLLDYAVVGSSLSLRSVARLASSVSLVGASRFGSSVSVLCIMTLGSALSLRRFSRIASTVSLIGLSRLGASLSVVDFAHLGASLSIRSFLRSGSTISILGSLRLQSDFEFLNPDASIYARDASGALTRRITFPSAANTGGVLHGYWTADSVISTSDRRFKTDVTPLHRTLLSRMTPRGASGVPANGAAGHPGKVIGPAIGDYEAHVESGGPKNDRAFAVDWVLRELRPVSFEFRRATDSKAIAEAPRYGFVAQEVERVAPDLVRDDGDTKYLVYQDIIAMVTMAAQDHQERLERHDKDVMKLRGLVGRLGEKLGGLQKRVGVILDTQAGRGAAV